MKASYSWLQNHFDKKLPTPEVLADLFTFHSFEVEGIENVKTSGGEDTIIDVKVLPDRAHYCLSHRGIAEEVLVLTGLPMKSVSFGCPADIDTKVSVDIQVPDFCPRYVARYVENIEIKDSPQWLKDRLEAIGARSISNIVDATNCVMFDLGQPIHAFDADKVVGGIKVRKAEEGEKVTLLDGKEYTLTAQDHVVADDKGALDIAGIKGGKRAEVTAETKRIIVMVANFKASTVRKTSTRTGIRNDSSKRYENAITAEWALPGMNQVSSLIAELSPGAKFGEINDAYPVKEAARTIEVDPIYISKTFGTDVSVETMSEILTKMGIKVEPKAGNLSLTIPPHRLDLVIPEDIVEEVGRIYGYDKVKGTLPSKIKDNVNVTKRYYFAEKIKDALVQNGFSETYLYSLVNKGDIETAYPLARDKAFLRKNLSDNIAKALETNARNADLLGLDAIKIFEIGSVFTEKNETLMLGLGMTQLKKIKGFDTQKYLEDLIRNIFTSALNLSEQSLSSEIVRKANANSPQVILEVNLDALMEHVTAPATYNDLSLGKAAQVAYKPFSPYPFMVRDIAVFVPQGTEANAVWESIQSGIKDAKAESLIARSALFDTFTKTFEDGQTKTSYAYRLILQSKEKTLLDEEANAVMEKIYSQVKGKGWEVR